jgi:hypothetical protein
MENDRSIPRRCTLIYNDRLQPSLTLNYNSTSFETLNLTDPPPENLSPKISHIPININLNTGKIHFGDKMSHKLPNTIRIYLQNINGCKLYQHIDWQAAMKFVQQHDVGAEGLTETRTKWDTKIRT